MHISRLAIEGFRSLKAAAIKDIGPVTILHGLNNSGKSNVLAALDTIFSSKIQVDTTVVKGRETESKRVRGFYDGRVDNFRDNFYFNQVKTISFKVSVVFTDEELAPHEPILAQIPSTAPDGQKRIKLGDGHVKSCNFEGEIVYVAETAAEMTTRLVDFNTDYVIYKKGVDGKVEFLPGVKTEAGKGQAFVDALMSKMSDCFRLIPANRYLLRESLPSSRVQEAHLTPRNFKQWLYGAYMARGDFHRFEEIQSIFNAPPFEFGELGFSQEGNELEVMVKKNGLRLPINRIGSGLQQILYLIAVIALNKNKVLAIEELEINLSPAAQKDVFEMLKKSVRGNPKLLNQIFVTSHSDYFEARDDVKCFSVLYDEKNSCTQVAPWTVEWRKKHFYHDRVKEG